MHQQLRSLAWRLSLQKQAPAQCPALFSCSLQCGRTNGSAGARLRQPSGGKLTSIWSGRASKRGTDCRVTVRRGGGTGMRPHTQPQAPPRSVGQPRAASTGTARKRRSCPIAVPDASVTTLGPKAPPGTFGQWRPRVRGGSAVGLAIAPRLDEVLRFQDAGRKQPSRPRAGERGVAGRPRFVVGRFEPAANRDDPGWRVGA